MVLFVPLIVPLATISRSDSDALSFVNNVGKPAIVPCAGPKEMLSTLALRASGAELAAAGNGSITMNGKIPDVMTRVLHFMMAPHETPNTFALTCRPIPNCVSDRQSMRFGKYTLQFGDCNSGFQGRIPVADSRAHRGPSGSATLEKMASSADESSVTNHSRRISRLQA